MAKLVKIKCEICDLADKKILHYHHIIPQCDAMCHNGKNNISILCPNCHSSVHAGDIIIIGVYPSSDGRCLMWFKKGEEPPISKEFWLVKDNPLVLTIGGESDDLENMSDEKSDNKE